MAQKELHIKISETPSKKRILKYSISIAVAILLLTATVISVVMLVKNLTAGGKVLKVSEVVGLKSAYYVGDEPDLEGATLRATYEDGRTEVVEITEDMLEGFDSSKPGKVDVTIKYRERSVQIPVTFVPLKVRYLRVDEATSPTVVYSGVPFPAGMYVNAEMIDDSVEHVPVTSDMVKGFNPLTVGNQNITITYLNASVTLTVKVCADEIDRVELHTDKFIYNVGEAFSEDKVSLAIVYKSGMTRTVKAAERMMLTPFDSTTAGDRSLVFRYGEFEVEYEYKVI